MTIRPLIVLGYARSGGTILNKCLSSLPSTIVMSEVNPHGGGSGVVTKRPLNNIKDQAQEWYDIKLESNSFQDLVSELNLHCTTTNKRLVIRDWSIVDFEPLPENNFNPKNDFSILKDLDHLNPIVIGFVRNAIDVWISRGQPDMNNFFQSYYSYISALQSLHIPIFKYENFTQHPDIVLKKICETGCLKFQDVVGIATTYKKVNGDIQKGSDSRGQRSSKIRPLKRQIIPHFQVRQLNDCALMKKANQEMDYGTNYFDEVPKPVYYAKRLGQFYYRNKRIYFKK